MIYLAPTCCDSHLFKTFSAQISATLYEWNPRSGKHLLTMTRLTRTGIKSQSRWMFDARCQVRLNLLSIPFDSDDPHVLLVYNNTVAAAPPKKYGTTIHSHFHFTGSESASSESEMILSRESPFCPKQNQLSNTVLWSYTAQPAVFQHLKIPLTLAKVPHESVSGRWTSSKVADWRSCTGFLCFILACNALACSQLSPKTSVLNFSSRAKWRKFRISLEPLSPAAVGH